MSAAKKIEEVVLACGPSRLPADQEVAFVIRDLAENEGWIFEMLARMPARRIVVQGSCENLSDATGSRGVCDEISCRLALLGAHPSVERKIAAGDLTLQGRIFEECSGRVFVAETNGCAGRPLRLRELESAADALWNPH